MILKFYKEPSNRWYVDLPEWKGSKDELEMVAGADSMLDYMSEGEDEISLKLDIDDFEGSDVLEFKEIALELENGAYYLMKNYRGINIDLELWLCDVTKFVFGNFPEKIYLCKI